ncbi:hypothetical protein G6F32_016885 [Rhizopus arrhizus]|nr:hypothetical protein G6F32_016885 [Rhizopus arrhizus]
MQQRVFDRFGMTRTSMMWREDFAGNLADGWTAQGAAEPHDERSRVRAAGSMDTTIGDMARFAAGYVPADHHCQPVPHPAAGAAACTTAPGPGGGAGRGDLPGPAGCRLLQGRPR